LEESTRAKSECRSWSRASCQLHRVGRRSRRREKMGRRSSPSWRLRFTTLAACLLTLGELLGPAQPASAASDPGTSAVGHGDPQPAPPTPLKPVTVRTTGGAGGPGNLADP